MKTHIFKKRNLVQPEDADEPVVVEYLPTAQLIAAGCGMVTQVGDVVWGWSLL
jgi:hypothetical protein